MNMLKLKVTLGFVALMMTQSSLAYVTCVGETYAGTVVQVSINTTGSMAFPEGGHIAIQESSGKAKAYTIKKDEIAQFFESVNPDRAIVGLSSYQELNNPIWINYVGKNYEDNLFEALRDPNREKQQSNEMRVWKGPGYGPNEQYQFTDVICSVGLDV